MSDSFYITTTLPYVNADPHIGFALEIIQADVLARYHQEILGENVFFNTGTDEHGQKIYQKALELGIDPQTYCDEYAAKFDNLKKALNLSYNAFIRTTKPHHLKAAQDFWQLCRQNGDIYKKNYKIKYCVGCELEKTESELENGCCPLHPTKKLEIREEENYFFKFSRYQQLLLDLYNKYPDFVIPSWRLEEIRNFVSQGLQDFSISRLKSKMPWGIPVPDDPEHVMYVWFDALINYISTLGWPENKEVFTQFWGTADKPNALQLAGKDNLRQQAAMWQAMLMSAGLPSSRQIFIHGFITANGQKMSKSLGNVIDPFDLVKRYGTDSVRYYLLKEINPFEDGDFSQKRFIELYNSDLANGLGNLVQRVAKLCEKNEVSVNFNKESNFIHEAANNIESYNFHLALETIWNAIRALDKTVNDTHPWTLSREEAKAALEPIVFKLEAIAFNLQPFLPDTAQNIIDIVTAQKIKAPELPLFPRLAF